MRRPPRSTLFPSTPLFRSRRRPDRRAAGRRAGEAAPDRDPARVGADVHRVVTLPFDSLDAALYSDRKSTRLNSSHANIAYAVFFLKNKIRRSDAALRVNLC